MRSNPRRSVLTLSANPWSVTHCFTWMPMLAILRPAVHTPVSPGSAPRRCPSRSSAPISVASSCRRYQCRSRRCAREAEGSDSRRAAPARGRSRPRRARPRPPRRRAAPARRAPGQARGPRAPAERDHGIDARPAAADPASSSLGHAPPAQRALQLERLGVRLPAEVATPSGRLTRGGAARADAPAGAEHEQRRRCRGRARPGAAGRLVQPGSQSQHRDHGGESAHEARGRRAGRSRGSASRSRQATTPARPGPGEACRRRAGRAGHRAPGWRRRRRTAAGPRRARWR